MWYIWERTEMQRGFELGSLKETGHMEDISVYRKTHKVVLKK